MDLGPLEIAIIALIESKSIIAHCMHICKGNYTHSKEVTKYGDIVFPYRLGTVRICNNFKKKRAFYDKSMKLGTCLVDSNTK